MVTCKLINMHFCFLMNMASSALQLQAMFIKNILLLDPIRKRSPIREHGSKLVYSLTFNERFVYLMHIYMYIYNSICLSYAILIGVGRGKDRERREREKEKGD